MLVMIVVLVIGVVSILVSSLSATAIENRRNRVTAEALAKAKEALIGYAVTYGDTHTSPPKTHGYLPCPDLNGNASSPDEGSSDLCVTSTSNSIGRLPWRTLDMPAFVDGAGECLWYAVSGNYKSTTTNTSMNWDTPVQLHVYAEDGVTEISPSEIVAVVIAPGSPVSGNSNRAGSDAPTCGGNYTAAAYLDNDTIHSRNNADGATGNFIMPHEHRDASGNVTLTVNDKFVFITRQDIWHAIQKRIMKQAKKCLDDYASDAANTNHKYPWAAQLSDTNVSPGRTGTVGVRFGRFPDSPNINTSGGGGSCPSSPSPLSGFTAGQITTLNNAIQQVQDALNTYIGNPSSTNLNNLENAGDNLWDLAKDPPYNLPIGDPIRSAGWWVDTNCGSSSTCNTTTIQSKLDAAFAEITDCTGAGADSSMPSDWSGIGSCQQLVTSASWPNWRDLIFFQIADGFQPGAVGSCTTGTTCLSITGSGHINAGSGSYHAVVVAASKGLAGQNRAVTATVSNFLDGAINTTGKVNVPTTTNFETYRASDAGYSSVNDLALCIDGKNNCP